MTYAEELQDGRWQERRLEVLRAADFRCERCHRQRLLDVHHKRYLPGLKPWEYPDADLVVLCDYCHESEHGIAGRVDVLVEIQVFLKAAHDRGEWDSLNFWADVGQRLIDSGQAKFEGLV